MEIKLIDHNGEKMAFFTFFDPNNRNFEVTKLHKKTHDFLGIPINYIQIDYRYINHGGAMECIINQSSGAIDYFCFIDNDCLILRRDAPQIIYEKLKDKRTVFGGAQNSNHIHVNPTHPFVQPSSFCISNKLYNDLGKPHLGDRIKRSDTCEEVTWLCQEKGYNVCLIYPSYYHELSSEECASSGNPVTWRLTDTLSYGLGTTYGNLFFHSGMQSLPRSFELFKLECNKILKSETCPNWLSDILEKNKKNKIEAVVVCVNRGDFLEITLPINKDKFDNFVVVTSKEDEKTQEICKNNNVEFVITDKFYDNGAKFDKGKAINEGFKKLKYNNWVIHLDCDVVLPEDFIKNLDFKSLDKNILYGIPRWFIKTKQDWLDYASGKKVRNDFEKIEGGWGCGYIQIFNMSADQLLGIDQQNIYPSYPTAGESDILFLKIFHPDVVSVGKLDHLEVLHLGGYGIKHDGTDDTNINFFKNET